MISNKERTKALFRAGLHRALTTVPIAGMEVTRAFYKELAQAVATNPTGCILRCQNQIQSDETERWLKKHRLTQYTVKIVGQE